MRWLHSGATYVLGGSAQCEHLAHIIHLVDDEDEFDVIINSTRFCITDAEFRATFVDEMAAFVRQRRLYSIDAEQFSDCIIAAPNDADVVMWHCRHLMPFVEMVARKLSCHLLWDIIGIIVRIWAELTIYDRKKYKIVSGGALIV